jgi:hypothetical protein
MAAYHNAQTIQDTVDEPRTPTQDIAPPRGDVEHGAGLLAAFRALGKGVEPGPAFQRTRAWYRRGGPAAPR